MIQKVKAATGDNIHIALDTISEKETQFIFIAIKALAEGAPGKLLIILLPVEGIFDARKDVGVTCSSHISPYLISEPPLTDERYLSPRSHNNILRLRDRL